MGHCINESLNADGRGAALIMTEIEKENTNQFRMR